LVKYNVFEMALKQELPVLSKCWLRQL
jgi:hypothetical protein